MHHLLALLLAAHFLTHAAPKPADPCWFPHGVAYGGGGSSGTLAFNLSANSGLLAALGGF